MKRKHLLVVPVVMITLLGSQTSYSQSVVPASVNETPVASATADAHHVNCDMVYHAGGGHLRAIAYDDYTNGNVNVYVEDYSAGSVAVRIPDSKEADIVIGDDLTNPGTDYLLNVVYTTSRQEIWFDIYRISGTGSSSLSSALIHSQLLGVNGDRPHIDLWPDVSVNIKGLAALHNFAITWAERSSTFPSVRLVSGDLRTPSITNTLLLSPLGDLPDVAALFDLSTRNAYAYVPFFTPVGDLDLVEVNLTTNSIVGITNRLDRNLGKNIRIEAMNQYRSSNRTAKYQILYQVCSLTPSTHPFKMKAYNDLAGNYDVSSARFSGTDNFYPAVAGGVGPAFGGGSYSNNNYSISWNAVKSAAIPTQAVDAITGSINTLYPDYYLANFNAFNTPVSFIPHESPVAISSSSNDGQGLLTVWVNKKKIWYKYNGDVTSYKPAGVISSVPMVNITLSPNPAINILNLESPTAGNYTITDMTGRLLLNGEIATGKNKVDVSALIAGLYTISITNATETNAIKFQKQ